MTNIVSRMEQVIQSSVDAKQFMGSVLVSRNGQVLLDKGFGFANLEWQIPNSPTTKFRIGSLTKQITAGAVMLLVDSGKINTSDPINKYLPNAPASWSGITIFNLLTHTSGIPNYTNFPEFAAITTLNKKPDEQIEMFRHKPLDFKPGTGYAYNNSGYVLLGYLIERVSGQSYRDFVVENIFKPLGMNDSGYDSHSAIITQRASGYDMGADGPHNTDYLDMSIPYAAGSLYSTTRDMLGWIEGVFAGKLLTFESLKLMTTPFKNNYGFGVIIDSIDGHISINHAGGINGFNTILIYSPEDKLAVISLSNMNAIGYVAQDVAMKMMKLARGHEIILPEERNIKNVSHDAMAKCVGNYKLKTSNISYTPWTYDFNITLENGGLTAQLTGQQKVRLYPESETRFFANVPDMLIEFELGNNNATRLTRYQDGEEWQGIRE